MRRITSGEYWNARNVKSLEAIPAGLIDNAWRAELIERANGGQEVYAYTAPHLDDQEARWFVWDDTTYADDSMYPGVRYALDELVGGRP